MVNVTLNVLIQNVLETMDHVTHIVLKDVLKIKQVINNVKLLALMKNVNEIKMIVRNLNPELIKLLIKKNNIVDQKNVQ